MKVFFCNFNDPLYVKLEKLEIMIRLVDLKTVDQFLHETKEYAQGLDVPFVRKAVSAIGRWAIKLDKAADKWVQALIELVRSKVDYLVQESVKVIKDILRRYPNRYESFIKDFCDNLKALNHADERAAMIWIVGEYADKISNSILLIESFTENLKEEAVVVQHAILTAAVKIYLKLGEEAEETLVSILKMTTEEAENPDLRSRGYVYWRLLTSNVNLAKELILEEKPVISMDSENIDPILLDSLIAYLGTLYSVSMKPPAKTIIATRDKISERFDIEGDEEVEVVEVDVEDSAGVKRNEYKGEANVETFNDLIGLGEDDGNKEDTIEESKQSKASEPDLLDEMLGISSTSKQSKPSIDDDFSIDVLDSPPKSVSTDSDLWRIPEKKLISDSDAALKTGKTGIEVIGSLQRTRGNLILELTIRNCTQFDSINDFALKLNSNSFGLIPVESLPDVTLDPGQSHKYYIAMNVNENNSNKAPTTPITVDCALKTSQGIYVFQIPVMLSVLLVKQGAMANVLEAKTLMQIPTEENMYHKNFSLSSKLTSPQKIKERLFDNNFGFIEEGRTDGGSPWLYFFAKTTNNLSILLQLIFKDGDWVLCVKSKVPSLIPLTQQWVSFILSSE